MRGTVQHCMISLDKRSRHRDSWIGRLRSNRISTRIA